MNCSAEQSSNWLEFWEKVRSPKRKNMSTWPHWGKMRNNLLIIHRSFDSFHAVTVVILVLWCRNLNESEPPGASTERCSILAFKSMNINTSLNILVLYSLFKQAQGKPRMFTYQVWYQFLWCVCYFMASFSSCAWETNLLWRDSKYDS